MRRVAAYLTVAALYLTGCAPAGHVGPSDTSTPLAQQEVAPLVSSDHAYSILSSDVAEPYVEPSGYDILSTSLDLSFDFERLTVGGAAEHRIRISADSLRQFWFDAADMEVGLVTCEGCRRSGQDTLQVAYTGTDLAVVLRSAPRKGDTVSVRIEYTAYPMRNGEQRGMYFVDPAGQDPNRPTQVWTLGQPQDNQFWFPTWDHPTERMSFDIRVTVPDFFETAGNGELVSQEALPGGLRQDRWVLKSEVPAYLAAVIIGDYTIITDSYERPDGSSVPLWYAVEPEYAEWAELIYPETPEIMAFVERKTRVRYPYENYKQFTVRDFTAGAQENVTATAIDASLQHDARAHEDYNGLSLVVHEIAHQWFGNLVTCKTWGYLALQEGMATYFETLYLEDAYGLNEAQAHSIANWDAYLFESEYRRRPIVWHGYSDPNEMFDHHSYEKTAAVLHQLRFELGDEAWWRGVRRYLTENRNQAVTLRDLQFAMERASARPLGRFFEQWFLSPGHPELEVSQRYREDFGVYEVHIQQVQDTTLFPVFAFDVDLELNFKSREPYVERIRVENVDTTIVIGVAGHVTFARFNRGDWLPAEITVDKPLEEWTTQALADDDMSGRYRAVEALSPHSADDQVRALLLQIASSDPSEHVRELGVRALRVYTDESRTLDAMLGLALNDPSSSVRAAAVEAIAGARSASVRSVLSEALQDRSYFVVAAAVESMARTFPGEAMDAFKPILGLRSWHSVVERALLAAASNLGGPIAYDYAVSLLGPTESESVRSSALSALGRLASVDEVTRSKVVALARAHQEDVHDLVRASAERVLDTLQ
jgi:aminopeptidase N